MAKRLKKEKTALMKVGIVTLPLKIQYFGPKVAFIRKGSCDEFIEVLLELLKAYSRTDTMNVDSSSRESWQQ